MAACRRGDHDLTGQKRSKPVTPCVSIATLNTPRLRRALWGSASGYSLPWGRQGGEARTDPRTTNQSDGSGGTAEPWYCYLLRAMGVARRTVRHAPCGVKSYTG